MKKPTPTTRVWPCVFAQPAVRESVDPWISDEWLSMFGAKAPFGDLRNMWRRHHCRTLNPYGSESCPYLERDCVEAFRDAIASVFITRPRVPVGYFIRVAKTSAARRADEKPLARDRVRRAPSRTAGPSHAGDPGDRPASGQVPVSGAQAGPVSIGEVLGSLDPRSRSMDQRTRKESTE